jgi:anaphase-promoting complex subunit 1
MTSSPHIKICIEAVKHILPKDTALQVFIKWYSTQNSPGGITNQSEWNKFVKCLLGMMGYDTEKLAIMQQLQDLDLSRSPAVVAKKARPSDEGSSEV